MEGGRKVDKRFVALDNLAELARGGDKEAEQALDALASKDLSKASETTAEDVLLSVYAQWEKAEKGL